MMQPRSFARPRRAGALGLLCAALALTRGSAFALPALGAPAPSVHLDDAYGRTLDLRMPYGRPVLVLYEDSGSSSQNAPLKEDLARLAKGDRYREAVALVPVADVSSFDFWPIRGIVAGAIRTQSQKFATTIYCDWSGAFRTRFGLRKGTSTVLLVAPDGSVLFAQEGALSAADRERLIALLRDQVAAK
jgi:hypothetical protein